MQVSHVLASLQAGNRGTQACITAASAVAGIIADLDTTIMFATAGTLNRENTETFADHRCLSLQRRKNKTKAVNYLRNNYISVVLVYSLGVKVCVHIFWFELCVLVW